MNNQKSVFKIAFIYFAIIMILLPPFAAINSFMTHSLDRSGWYKPIQKYIVPFQARLVAITIRPLGIDSKVVENNKIASFFMLKDGGAIPVDLSWNCLGWQSALILIVSLFIGLSGNHSRISQIMCIAFGFFGTLLMNVFRMSLISVGIFYINVFTATIVHDYLAAFFTLIWLMIFWWFSYKYILE